jgi:predicted nucleic acid-binding protein
LAGAAATAMNYLLDACSMIAVYNREPGASIVLDLLDQARAGTINLYMSIVQLLEVYYDQIYTVGAYKAKKAIDSILEGPVNIIYEISIDDIYKAGWFKTHYSMSLADAIAAATAISINATLVTKDSEMKPAEEADEFPVLWLK